MEELVDAMTTVCLVDGASVLFSFCLDDGSKVAEQTAEGNDGSYLSASEYLDDKAQNGVTHTPGFAIAIATSRHSLAVLMSLSESLSILPTGYVAFRSPWKLLNAVRTTH